LSVKRKLLEAYHQFPQVVTYEEEEEEEEEVEEEEEETKDSEEAESEEESSDGESGYNTKEVRSKPKLTKE
jgi:hypothetical protein